MMDEMDARESRRLKVNEMMRARGLSSMSMDMKSYLEEERSKIDLDRKRLVEERLAYTIEVTSLSKDCVDEDVITPEESIESIIKSAALFITKEEEKSIIEKKREERDETVTIPSPTPELRAAGGEEFALGDKGWIDPDKIAIDDDGVQGVHGDRTDGGGGGGVGLAIAEKDKKRRKKPTLIPKFRRARGYTHSNKSKTKDASIAPLRKANTLRGLPSPDPLGMPTQSVSIELEADEVRWLCPDGVHCASTDPEHFLKYQHTDVVAIASSARKYEEDMMKKAPPSSSQCPMGGSASPNKQENVHVEEFAQGGDGNADGAAIDGHGSEHEDEALGAHGDGKGSMPCGNAASLIAADDARGADVPPASTGGDGDGDDDDGDGRWSPKDVRPFEQFHGRYVWMRDTILGRGGYATVYQGKDRASGQAVAIKVISAKKVRMNAADPAVELANVWREMELALSMNHSNIIKCHDAFFEGESMENWTRVYIIMELLQGGSLADLLRSGGRFSEEVTQSVAHHVLHGVRYLHQQGIAHRDIKLSNVMAKKKGIYWDIRIVDFGISCRAMEPVNDVAGSLGFMAPEVLRGEPYTFSVDMWSVGVVVFALLFGRLPIVASSEEEMIRLNCLGEYVIPEDDSVSSDAKSFIRSLMCSVDERLSAADALLHPWIRTSRSIIGKKKLQANLLGKYLRQRDASLGDGEDTKTTSDDSLVGFAQSIDDITSDERWRCTASEDVKGNAPHHGEVFQHADSARAEDGAFEPVETGSRRRSVSAKLLDIMELAEELSSFPEAT